MFSRERWVRSVDIALLLSREEVQHHIYNHSHVHAHTPPSPPPPALHIIIQQI